MKKDFELLLNKIDGLQKEITELKKAASVQNEEIASLRKQLEATTTVKIEENGKQNKESYGNLILDELISLKKKLEGFSAEGLRSVVNDVAALKNRIESNSNSPDFSLSELKDELLKLADMIV